MLNELKDEVYRANKALVEHGLVVLTWGNVSGIDRDAGLFVIKPSGVPYADLKPEYLVVVDLDGKVAEGTLNPSSDEPTHRELYRAFEGIGGVTHTHSRCATAFAQAGREIPPLGTTHADHFHGPVPLARLLTAEEVEADYEGNTGKVIVERFESVDPLAVPAVLATGHGPFTWGRDAADSVKNSVALEEVAHMALLSLQIDPECRDLPAYMQDKHFYRKHGPDATYGQ